jgi:TetR/AcrR family transcriptional repressor of nem operon
MCLFGVLGAEAGGLSPEIANEIQSFFRRCVEDLSQRIGGLDAEARAFQVIATLEGGMMLARAYQDTQAFDQAVAGLVSPFHQRGGDIHTIDFDVHPAPSNKGSG